MAPPSMTSLLLIRHARSATAGRLAGRLDVTAELPPEAVMAQARRNLAVLWENNPHCAVTSPAQRCKQTALALLPDMDPTEDARLREQDFGEWEGLEAASLPDLGPLGRAETAAFRPPGGESFFDLTARAAPALREIAASGPAVVFTHAGTIRAGLGLALGDMAQGLAFEVAPLSATLLRALPGGDWSIGFINLPLLHGSSPP